MASIDEQVFRKHIEEGPFQNGVDRGRWRLISIAWPQAIIAVSAAARQNSPNEYFLRFELTNYPQVAPTAQPWNIERQTPLQQNHWPGGRSRIPAAFNPSWKNGQCLYLPCDRLSIEGHEDWKSKYLDMLWSPSGDITQYIRIVYDLLNSTDYTGIRSS